MTTTIGRFAISPRLLGAAIAVTVFTLAASTADAHWFLGARRFYGPDHTGWGFPNARYMHGWGHGYGHGCCGPHAGVWSAEKGVMPDGAMMPYSPDGHNTGSPAPNKSTDPRTLRPGIPSQVPFLAYEANEAVTIAVAVPDDARLFVNGAPTRITGPYRQLVSREVETGATYRYELRAEIERNGKTLTESKSIDVKTGDVVEVEFNFANAASREELVLPQTSAR